MGEEVVSLLNNLLQESPYLLLFVLAFFLFYHMHKNSMEKIVEESHHTTENIRLAYQEAHEKLNCSKK